MNTYGLVKINGDVITVDAEGYEISERIVTFMRGNLHLNAWESFCSYNMDTLESITLQTNFSEEKVLKQVNGH